MKKFFYGRSHVNKNRKLLNLSLAIFSVLIFGIVTAYAALNMTVSTRFNLVRQRYIDNSSNSDNGYNWDGWNNYNANVYNAYLSSGSGGYNYNSSSYNEYPSCGSVSVYENRIIIDQTYGMSGVGSKCFYRITLSNNSSTPARVGYIEPIRASFTYMNDTNLDNCSISNDANSQMNCSKTGMRYTLSEDVFEDHPITPGFIIPSYGTADIYLIVTQIGYFNDYGWGNLVGGGFRLYFGV